MKDVTITAYNGTGKDKVKAGERPAKQPETLAEAQTLFSDEDILEGFWASHVIEVQRQIRAGTTMSAKAILNQLQAFAKANPDSPVAKQLEAMEISFKGNNGEANGEAKSPEGEESKPEGETPTPPPAPEPEKGKGKGKNRR